MLQGEWSKSGMAKKFLTLSIHFCRGSESKTQLSLVDKIELGRTYQPITGEGKNIHIYI